jgi:hypothetical protein
LKKFRWGRRTAVIWLLMLAVSIAAAEPIAGYVSPAESVPLEVKEPIRIVDYPAALSLFPGETKGFSVTIENDASVNYSVTLSYLLNDTEYQATYVTFDNETYKVHPGEQTLDSWLTVSFDAPSGNFLMTINFSRGNSLSEPTPVSPPLNESSLKSSLMLLEGGAKWAAGGKGSSVLFVNGKDNWVAHHLTDGAKWGPWWSEEFLDYLRSSVSQTLDQAGFDVHFAGDIPDNLSGYDLVVVEAFWAVEPKNNALFREYVANGGGVVILGGVPCYFSVYCKDFWPYRFGGTDLTPLEDWFGCRYYVNVGGTARVVFKNPFGTSLSTSEALLPDHGNSAAGVSYPGNNTKVIASWDEGPIFAFTNEYGEGRVYYQAAF